MAILALNGSPRKNWNTHILLMNALEGAASKGICTELIHLYDLSYKGCFGCLECKRKGSRNLGRCVVNDALKPVLAKIHTSDGLIIGSPIYFGEVTGMTRSFMERLLFQYNSYDKEKIPLIDRQIQTVFIYTMNQSEQSLGEIGYSDLFRANEVLFGRILGPLVTLVVTETCQVDDYDRYHMTQFDAARHMQRRKDAFPEDCKKAFELGAALAQTAQEYRKKK
jgi:multimeric flavodoxin WrbA